MTLGRPSWTWAIWGLLAWALVAAQGDAQDDPPRSVSEELVRRSSWRDAASWELSYAFVLEEGGSLRARRIVRHSERSASTTKESSVEIDGDTIFLGDREFRWDERAGMLLDRRCVGWRLLPDRNRWICPFLGVWSADPFERREDLWWLVQNNDPMDFLLMEDTRADDLACLSDPDPEVQALAAFLAGRFQIEESVDSLRYLLRDPIPTVRREAAEALGSLGDATDLARLRALVEDPDETVRAHAEAAITALRGR